MFLLWGDEAQGAVVVAVIVAADEGVGPSAGGMNVGKALRGQRGVVFGGAEEGLGVGVVVADAGPGAGGLQAEGVHEGKHSAGFEGAAVVAVQDDGGGCCRELFGERCAAQQGPGVLGVFLFPDLGCDDFSAEQIDDGVEFVEAPGELAGQPGDVPAPDFVGRAGGVCGPRRGRPGGACAAPVVLLAGRSQDAVEGRFAGEVNAFVGEFDDDLRGRL